MYVNKSDQKNQDAIRKVVFFFWYPDFVKKTRVVKMEIIFPQLMTLDIWQAGIPYFDD